MKSRVVNGEQHMSAVPQIKGDSFCVSTVFSLRCKHRRGRKMVAMAAHCLKENQLKRLSGFIEKAKKEKRADNDDSEELCSFYIHQSIHR